MPETLLSPSNILLFGRVVEDLEIRKTANNNSPFLRARAGGDRDLENRLTRDSDPMFARIYGFSYEGSYYDLPRPALFLVHGAGETVTTTPRTADARPDKGQAEAGVAVDRSASARAPGEPSLSGVAAAEFQFADEIKVWSYDRADHTIRMDVESGEFEDVLLGMTFGKGPRATGAHVSGAHVSGAHVSGAHVSGAHVSGAHVSGARLRGRNE